MLFHSLMNKINLRQFKGDFQGGFGAGIFNLFQCVPFGLIAFAPLGPEYANAGIMACIIGTTMAGFFASLFGGSPAQITSPGVAVCLVFSYIIAHIMSLNLFDPTSANYITLVLSLTFFSLFLSGLIQVLFGVFKVDFLIKFISYPVVAGIATGSGIVIILNGFWNLLGLSDDLSWEDAWQHLHKVQLGSLFVGIATAIILHYRTLFIKGTFGFPVAIGIGTGIYYVLLYTGFTSENLGGTFGKFHFAIPTSEHFTSTLHLLGDSQIFSYTKLTTSSAVNLAILCSLQSLLSILAIKNISNKSGNSSQELIGQGIGNMMSGIFGGLPACGTFSRSILNYQEGGRTKLSGMISGLTTFFLAFLFSPYIEYLPQAVVSGVLIAFGINAIDKWAMQLFYQMITRKIPLSSEVIESIAIILVVVGLILTGNFIPAIGAGVILSIMVFLARMRGLLIKRVYETLSVPSKKIVNEKIMDFLTRHHQDIRVLELGGIIYFGSAERLSEEIVKLSESGVIYFILDMKNVTHIDLTGARVLVTICNNLKQQGKQLGFSYLRKESPVWIFLDNIGFFKKNEFVLTFSDTDHALEYYEDKLLANFPQIPEDMEMELPGVPAFQNLTAEEMKILESSLRVERYKEGQTIFKQGDVADAMFFIAKGSVDILISVGIKNSLHTKRVQSISRGAFFGEMGLLQGGTRTATVVASSDLVCYRLSLEDFRSLMQKKSQLSYSLLINICKILSKRIIFINQLISEMEG